MLRDSLLALAFLVTPSSSVHVQQGDSSQEEVRAAMADYFGPDDVSAPARERLSRWGTRALPALKQLVPAVAADGMESHVDAAAAGEVLVDLLLAEADRPPGQASLSCLRSPRENETIEATLHDPRTRPVVVAHLDDEIWLARKHAVEIVGIARWEEALPKVRELLADPHRAVREAAATTLESLASEGPPVPFRARLELFPAGRVVRRASRPARRA